MSLEEQARREAEAVDPEVCEWCGGEIEFADDGEPRECPACDDGRRCSP